ncbi:glycosyl hydrolase family 18 protein [Actinacidiphila oryziradicis]|uniref:glycosyl hydrolase family 18 protein n=1 Tax=Actinacidiphila oryziradicis TaxID=2571141 RepID=UPI001FE2451E|nr:glycosyl hydrolase family 18 protein [Actinacidiphila oryziradicis]
MKPDSHRSRHRLTLLRRLVAVCAIGALAAVGLTAQAHAADTNILTNPGFESGLTGWTCTAGSGSTVSSPVHGGSSALKAVPTDSDNAQCSQTVAVQPGSAYTLSGYVQGAYVYIGATGTGGTDPSNWVTTTSYQLLSTSFTTGASTTSVTIWVHGWYSQGAYYADDFSLVGPSGGGTTDSPPSAPGTPSASNVTSTSLTLNWTAATDDHGVQNYDVYRGTTKIATVTGTTYNDTGLTAATTYTYSVKARDTANQVGPSSGVLTVTTAGSGTDSPPSAPGTPSASNVTSTSLTLNWTAATDDHGVQNYDVYRGTTKIATVTGTTYNDTGLTAATTYTYSVKARDTANQVGPSSGVLTVTTSGTSSGGGGSTVKMGYFADWGVYGRQYFPKNIETSGSASKLTTINYAFGNVTNGQCAIGDAYADYQMTYTAANSVDGTADTWDQPVAGAINQLRELKKLHPGLKIIWSFGGWSWSGGFAQAAANPGAFATSCYNLVEDPRWADVFDGIDIDWEYPNSCGLSCDTSGPAAYTNLMSALRGKFGSDLVTSAITADGSSGGKLDAADYGGAAQYVDWYNVMSYDYFGAWAAQGPTAPHSPLYSYSGIPTAGFYSDAAIQKLKSKGVPGSKMNLGIGFYGRGWTGVTQDAPGGTATGPAAGTYEQGIEDYKVLKTKCPATGTVAGTAYAHCGSDWWSYDTPSTIAGKMTYAKNQGLRGAFFWEFSGDTSNGELVTALSNGLG